MTNRAVITTREIPLTTNVGEKLAREWFGDIFVENLPKYQEGENEGKFKGVFIQKKVEKAGWVDTEDGEGYVENCVGKVICTIVYGISPDDF